MSNVEHDGHGEGQGPQPQGDSGEQAEQERLDGLPVLRPGGDKQPAQPRVGKQGEKHQQQPRRGGGEQLAQVDAYTGQSVGHLVFQGARLVLVGKHRVGHYHGQVDARREEGDQQGQALPEGALEHALPPRPPPDQGQGGGQGRHDGQVDPVVGPGHGLAPLGGQIGSHSAAPYLISFRRKASRPMAVAAANHTSPESQHRPT